MAKQVTLRQGTAAEHASFTGAAGEVTYNTDADSLRVHDGYTQGGYELLRKDLDNLAASSIDISKINPSGDPLQVLRVNSAGNSLEYGLGFDVLKDVGLYFDNAGAEGPAGPSSNAVAERYNGISVLTSSFLNLRQTSNGNQVITIQNTGRYFFKIAGAQGGMMGGLGGIAWGQVDLTAGDILYMYVGQMGNIGQSTSDTTPITEPESTRFSSTGLHGNVRSYGGFGGSIGGTSSISGTAYSGSGGGSTDIRLNTDALANRIIVAGGGGGSYVEHYQNGSGATAQHAHGGDGGGWVGLGGYGSAETTNLYSRGGEQSSGGNSSNGGTGTQAKGGDGPDNDGGGGGGGYWGGGGGGTNTAGAGGSGYVGGMISSLRGMCIGGNAGHGWIYMKRIS